MCAEVKTVATKHAQVWLREDTEALGWYRGPVLLTALGTSFDTWADMTHTLPAERAHRIRAGAGTTAPAPWPTSARHCRMRE